MRKVDKLEMMNYNFKVSDKGKKDQRAINDESL